MFVPNMNTDWFVGTVMVTVGSEPGRLATASRFNINGLALLSLLANPSWPIRNSLVEALNRTMKEAEPPAAMGAAGQLDTVKSPPTPGGPSNSDAVPSLVIVKGIDIGLVMVVA